MDLFYSRLTASSNEEVSLYGTLWMHHIEISLATYQSIKFWVEHLENISEHIFMVESLWAWCSSIFLLDEILKNGLVWRAAEMEKQATKICWKLVTKSDSIAVWHKPSNITATDCHIETLVPLCPLVPGPDAAWWDLILLLLVNILN